MRKKLIPLLLLAMLSYLPGEDIKRKDDFVLPEPTEKPLFDLGLQKVKPETGLWLSTAGLLTGGALTLLSMHSTMNNGLNDPGDTAMQRGIALTGSCLIGTAVCALLFSYFQEKRQVSVDFTSKE